MQAAVTAAEKTDVPTDIKGEIDKFSEGIPVLLRALNELKKLHPFIGGEFSPWYTPCKVTGKLVVVLAFEAVYTLEQMRRGNDKKVIALYVGMKDMMRVLLLSVLTSVHCGTLTSCSLEDVEIDKVIAPDGKSIENQFEGLVERTAEDIKRCSNVCDAYMKKRLLAKVLLCPVWDEKLPGFVTLFAQRRREFQLELTLHIYQSLHKANSKLEEIAYGVKGLDEKFGRLQFGVMMY